MQTRKESPLAPEIVPPPGVRVMVNRWNQWWECHWKGVTLCLPDNKGVVMKSEPVYVEGLDLTADEFAEKLRGLHYKFVGVGDPVMEGGA